MESVFVFFACNSKLEVNKSSKKGQPPDIVVGYFLPMRSLIADATDSPF